MTAKKPFNEYKSDVRPEFGELINQFRQKHPKYFAHPTEIAAIKHEGEVYRRIPYNRAAHHELLDFFADELGMYDYYRDKPMEQLESGTPYSLLFEKTEP